MSASPPKSWGGASGANHPRRTLRHHHLPPLGGGVCGAHTEIKNMRWRK